MAHPVKGKGNALFRMRPQRDGSSSAAQVPSYSDPVPGKFSQEGFVVRDDLHALPLGEGDEEGVDGFS